MSGRLCKLQELANFGHAAQLRSGRNQEFNMLILVVRIDAAQLKWQMPPCTVTLRDLLQVTWAVVRTPAA